MEFSYQRDLGSFLLVVMDVLVKSVQYLLFFWTNSSLSNDFRFHMLSIARLLYSSCACSVWASDNMSISSAEGEVRVVAWLAGYSEAYISLLPSINWEGYFADFFFIVSWFIFFQSPFYPSSDGENLKVCFELLGYKEQLDLYLQALL